MNTGWFGSAGVQSGWENVPFWSEARRAYRKWNHVTKDDLYAIDEMLRAEKKDREGKDSPWIRLANAVILQAAEDWRNAKKMIITLKPQFLRNSSTPRVSSSSCVFFWIAETLIPWPSPVSTR